MKEKGKLLLSAVEMMAPTYFTIAVLAEGGGEDEIVRVVFEGILGDPCASLFAQAFADTIVSSGEDAYLLVNECDLAWVRENLTRKVVGHE